MLLDFTVGNFGPFRDDATLSMNATAITEHPDNLLDSNLSEEDILSSAVIFGPNGAGKSHIIDAIQILKRVVKTVDGSIPSSLYTPCRLSESCRESPVRIRVRLTIEGLLYDYRVEYKAGEITGESLHYYPKNRPKRVFTRTGDEYVGAKKRIVAMTTSGRTYLAMASLNSDPLCTKVRNAILTEFVVLPPDLKDPAHGSCRFIEGDSRRKTAALGVLDVLDLGIDDIVCSNGQDRLVDGITTEDVFLRHRFASSHTDEEGRTIPIELESSGIQCILGLIPPLIDALENGKVLIIDDLGAHLHPMVTRWIVRQFSRDNNPHGAQLIAGTHDIGLMDTDGLLRRDQIWFVNKNREDGASELYSLSDFSGVRKDTDVLRRYLDGRFDAVPSIKHRRGIIRTDPSPSDRRSFTPPRDPCAPSRPHPPERTPGCPRAGIPASRRSPPGSRTLSPGPSRSLSSTD